MPKLSHRLQLILDQALPHEDLWDLCCDHGQLGAEALNLNRFKKIYLVDQVPSIIENLKIVYSSSPMTILCSDASKISQELYGNVVIAGVGGLNMKVIVDELIQRKVLKAKRLILSPHRDEPLYENRNLFKGYKGVKEFAFFEKNILRFVFVFDKN